MLCSTLCAFFWAAESKQDLKTCETVSINLRYKTSKKNFVSSNRAHENQNLQRNRVKNTSTKLDNIWNILKQEFLCKYRQNNFWVTFLKSKNSLRLQITIYGEFGLFLRIFKQIHWSINKCSWKNSLDFRMMESSTKFACQVFWNDFSRLVFALKWKIHHSIKLSTT